jgi:hypothetical protein
MGHGSTLCGAHFFAVRRIHIVESCQVEVSVDEIESQLFGEGQAAGPFELVSMHGGDADFASIAGLRGALESDHISQGVVLKKICVNAAHVFAGQEGHRKITFRGRPSVKSVENVENPPGISDRDRKFTTTVMQVY